MGHVGTPGACIPRASCLARTLAVMAILVWWVLPATTTLLAICWAAWVRRTPRPLGDADTVETYARFRAALSASVDVGVRNSAGPPTF